MFTIPLYLGSCTLPGSLWLLGSSCWCRCRRTLIRSICLLEYEVWRQRKTVLQWSGPNRLKYFCFFCVPVGCVHTQVGRGQFSWGDPDGQTCAWNPLGPFKQSRLNTDFHLPLLLETWHGGKGGGKGWELLNKSGHASFAGMFFSF